MTFAGGVIWILIALTFTSSASKKDTTGRKESQLLEGDAKNSLHASRTAHAFKDSTTGGYRLAAAIEKPFCHAFFRHKGMIAASQKLNGGGITPDLQTMRLLQQAGESHGRARASTWEDAAYFHDSTSRTTKGKPTALPSDAFIAPLAVGGTTRPVKLIVRLKRDEIPFVSLPIWKVASTTLTSMLRDAGGVGPHICSNRSTCAEYSQHSCSWSQRRSWGSWSEPRTTNLETGLWCQDPSGCFNNETLAWHGVVNPMGVCFQHGTFILDLSKLTFPSGGRVFMFAFVRDPLDRFLSTFRPMKLRKKLKDRFRGYDPHGTWELCHEKLCRETIEDLRHIAQVLELDLQRWAFGRPQPNTRHGMLTHALSQMYFLSASDAAGQPLQLDFVGRLENFEEDWAIVASRIGLDPASSSAVHENAGTLYAETGGNHIHQIVRTTVEQTKPIVCPLCRIYAQDYECLGYDKPKVCVAEASECINSFNKSVSKGAGATDEQGSLKSTTTIPIGGSREKELRLKSKPEAVHSPAIPIGSRVELSGLKQKPELNGARGIVTVHIPNGRYTVLIDNRGGSFDVRAKSMTIV